MTPSTKSTHTAALSDVTTGEELVNYLYDNNGLQYNRVSNFDSSGVAAADWDAFALRDNNGNTLITYIELSPSEDTPTLSDVKRHFKRHGRDDSELFTVIAKRDSEGTFLQTRIENEITFVRVEDRLSSGDVDIDFDLRIFKLDMTDIEPFYLDYLDELTVDQQDDLNRLRDRVEETFSLKAVTKRFYEEFGEIFQETLQTAIHDLDTDATDKGSYTQLVVNRILFLMFVQEKGWLDRNTTYVQDRYEDVRGDDTKHVYHDFFEPLFFDALNDPNQTEFDELGTIPYFNGGLFEKEDYEDEVSIDEEFFDALLDPEEDPNTHEPQGFLRRYKISLSESNPSEQQLVVDPEFIGRIFEMFMQSEERSEKGAFYTPKPITQYMAKNALKHYLFEDYADNDEAIIQLVANNEVPSSLDENTLSGIRKKLKNVRIVDPAVGSGAFIIAIIEELVGITETLNNSLGITEDTYDLKEEYIATSLYGVDIDSSGIELCKFRVWLHLMQDLPADLDTFIANNEKYALPNLGLKFFVGNSLVGDYEPTEIGDTLTDTGYQGKLTGDFDEGSLPERISHLRREYVDAHGDKKDDIENELNKLTTKLDEKISWDKSDHWMKEVVEEAGEDAIFKWSINFPEIMLDDDGEAGFDIVIGNPPYKGGTNPDYISDLSDFYDSHREEYVKPVRKMVYDLYQKFIFRGEELAREDGIFTYITSSTLRTIATKTASRNILQKNRLEELFITNPDTFDAAVHASIFTLRHTDASDRNYELLYVNGENSPINIYRDLIQSQPKTREDVGDDETIQRNDTVHDVPSYRIPIQVYRKSPRSTFFEPTDDNQETYAKWIAPVSTLLEEWEDELYDVDAQRGNLEEIKSRHINNLSPGDVTLLGLVTWGGEGLKTNDNKEHIAYIDGTYEAEQVKERNGDDFIYVEQNEEAYRWINRVVRKEDTINPSKLTEEERQNGIDAGERNGRTWVPIEKGSTIEDIYYKPTIEYIDWSEESLQKIDDRRGGRIRDPDYYFREAIFASRGGTGEYKSKARYIDNAVVDSSGVVIIPTTDSLPPKYLLGILNSNVMKYIIDNFINSTVNVQVADMRLLPIPVPSEEERDQIVSLVNDAIAVQKGEKEGEIEEIHQNIEEKVKDIYGIDVEYQAT
jgi:hypothetical protein